MTGLFKPTIMITDIKPYLHYYMGQTFWTPNSEGQINRTTLQYIMDMIDAGTKVQPILRRLSSLTDQERRQCDIDCGGPTHGEPHPHITHWARRLDWLVKRGFWVWPDEAFDNGLIIDAATIKTESK